MRRRWLLLLLLAVAAIVALPWLGRAVPDPVLARLPGPAQVLLVGPAPAGLPAPATRVLLPARLPTLDFPTPPGRTGMASAGLPAPATPTLHPTAAAIGQPATTPMPPPVDLPTPTPDATLAPSWPAAVRLQGVNIVPQTFNNCGPANVSMVLNFYGVPLDQEATGTALKPTVTDRNVSPDEIVRYVRDRTRLEAAFFVGADVDLLRRYLAAGYPIIIEKGFSPPDEDWMGHYLTLVGYDDRAGHFIGMDTFLGPWGNQGREESYETVDAYWAQFNRALIVIHRPEQAAEVASLAGEVLTDPVRMWQEAARRAEADVMAAPADAFAWFRLGASLTHLGDVLEDRRFAPTAAAAFDQARTLGLPYRMLWYQFEPYAAYLAVGRPQDVLDLAEATLETRGGQTVEETHYYRGLALRALGDETGAQAAFIRALGLKGHYAAAQAALAGD